MNTEIFDLGKIGITLGCEYNNETVYEKLTIVLYKGKSYISTKTTKGVSPEQDIKTWQLVAEAKDAYHMLVDAGKITLTEEEFLEQLVDATKGRYIVQGNVINAADEEDLTVEHSSLLGIDTLKLADRPSTDGMGYIILRKNKSFAEQVTKTNTIYEIRYEFDLGGVEIIIPERCILKFEGGKIKNGKLIGNNTVINAPCVSIFNNITLLESWNSKIAYSIWFDAKDDCILDDNDKYISGTNNLSVFVNLFKFQNIKILEGTYFIQFDSNNLSLYPRSGAIIDGGNATLKCFFYNKYISTITMSKVESVIIKNLNLIGNRDEVDIVTQYVAGINIIDSINCIITNITSKYNRGDGFYIGGNDNCSKNIKLENLIADHNHRQGLSITYAENINISNCKFLNTEGTNPQKGIDIEPNQGEYVNNVTINNCYFSGNKKGSIDLMDTQGNKCIKNISILNCLFNENNVSTVYICGGEHTLIKNCLFDNCGISTRSNWNFLTIEDCIINGEDINEQSGIKIQYSSDDDNRNFLTIRDVEIKNVPNYGLYIFNIANNENGIIDNIHIENINVHNCYHNIFIGNQAKNCTYFNIKAYNVGKKSDGTKYEGHTFGWNISFNDDIETRKDFSSINIKASSSIPTFKGNIGEIVFKNGNTDNIDKNLNIGDSDKWIYINTEWAQEGFVHKGLCGTTENRPSYSSKDCMPYYDTSIKKPMYWNGSTWVILADYEEYSDIYILYHDNLTNLPKLVKPSEWKTLENNGNIADGIYLEDNYHSLIIAPTTSTAKWNDVSDVLGNNINSFTKLFAYDGKEKTKSLLENEKFNKTDPDCLGYICSTYQRLNENGYGISAGKWYIPSIGEFRIIKNNLNKINYALSFIVNANLLNDNYWTCDEYYGSAYLNNIKTNTKTITNKTLLIADINNIDNGKLTQN